MDRQPFVSIIVPVRNEERYIERCLYAIAAQDYPRERTEVIVVDGMSEDRTREMVSRFAAESTLDLRMLDNPRRLPAAAMNEGLRAARGELILRVDGHAALAPDYLRRCVTALREGGVECAGGVLANEGETYLGQVIAAAMSSPFGVGGASFRTGGRGGDVDTVAFGVYRAEVFARLGGFDEDLERGEDDEFNYRLRDAGGRIVLVPEARAGYSVRDDAWSLWKQYFGYGRAKPRVLALHPRQVQPRQLVPAVSLLTGAIATSARLRGHGRLLRALMRAYLLASLFASLQAGRRFGWGVVPVLPAVFACLHLSYALGFASGVLGLLNPMARGSRPATPEIAERPFP